MHRSLQITCLIAIGLIAGCPLLIFAQAAPTATESLQIAAFGGLTGTYTGLQSGKNLGVTGGVDFSFLPHHGLYSTLELRGTYPINKGNIDSQKNMLGGIKIAARFGRLSPYGDLLFGRGGINYGKGYQVPATPIFYTQSSSNVLSLGGGLDLRLTDRLALKFDTQLQRYATPVAASGHVFAKSGTVGFVYRFDFNHHARQSKR